MHLVCDSASAFLCLANYPMAQVVWSDILPRACYFGALSPAIVEMKGRSTNNWSRSLSRRLGVGVFASPPVSVVFLSSISG